MWQAVNALERQPAAGRMRAGFGRADGGIKDQERKSHQAGDAGTHSEGSPVRALLSASMARTCLTELVLVAATRHQQQPQAHAETRPALALGTRGSKTHPHQTQLCVGPGTMTTSCLLTAGPP